MGASPGGSPGSVPPPRGLPPPRKQPYPRTIHPNTGPGRPLPGPAVRSPRPGPGPAYGPVPARPAARRSGGLRGVPANHPGPVADRGPARRPARSAARRCGSFRQRPGPAPYPRGSRPRPGTGTPAPWAPPGTAAAGGTPPIRAPARKAACGTCRRHPAAACPRAPGPTGPSPAPSWADTAGAMGRGHAPRTPPCPVARARRGSATAPNLVPNSGIRRARRGHHPGGARPPASRCRPRGGARAQQHLTPCGPCGRHCRGSRRRRALRSPRTHRRRHRRLRPGGLGPARRPDDHRGDRRVPSRPRRPVPQHLPPGAAPPARPVGPDPASVRAGSAGPRRRQTAPYGRGGTPPEPGARAVPPGTPRRSRPLRRVRRLGGPEGRGGSTDHGARPRERPQTAGRGPARRLPGQARGNVGGTARGPPRAVGGRGDSRPRAPRPYRRRLSAPAAVGAAVRSGADDVEPVRRSRTAQLRPGPSLRARRRFGGGARSAGRGPAAGHRS